MTLLIYIVISLINVFLHIVRSILVIKSSKLIASTANCICYTFSAVVIKFIAETDLWVAIAVQATTNFMGCYLAMIFCDGYLARKERNQLYVVPGRGLFERLREPDTGIGNGKITIKQLKKW